jgi:hypothetical protein
MFYAAVHESAFGTKQTSMRHRLMSAFGGKADIASMTTMSVFDPKRTFTSIFDAMRNGSGPHFAGGKTLL